MNKDAFWALIEKGREAGDDCNEQAAAVMEQAANATDADTVTMAGPHQRTVSAKNLKASILADLKCVGGEG